MLYDLYLAGNCHCNRRGAHPIYRRSVRDHVAFPGEPDQSVHGNERDAGAPCRGAAPADSCRRIAFSSENCHTDSAVSTKIAGITVQFS